MNSSLHTSIERHGGIGAYLRIESIVVKVVRLGGAIPALKGIGRTFQHPRTATIYPQRHSATFHQFGLEGEDITYSSGTICINGHQHDNYRRSFSGLQKLRCWSPNDAAYFFGYALSDYFGYPFTLLDRTVIATETVRDHQTRISVRFPANADTHSQIQSFVFDTTGLLVRHDYRADILGPIFFGAHYSKNYRFDTPIPVAETRNVFVRIGRWATPVSVLQANMIVERVTQTSTFDTNKMLDRSGGLTAS